MYYKRNNNPILLQRGGSVRIQPFPYYKETVGSGFLDIIRDDKLREKYLMKEPLRQPYYMPSKTPLESKTASPSKTPLPSKTGKGISDWNFPSGPIEPLHSPGLRQRGLYDKLFQQQQPKQLTGESISKALRTMTISGKGISPL